MGQLHSVEQWLRATEDPASGFNESLRRTCGNREDLRADAAAMCGRALRVFGQTHRFETNVLVIRSCGRVNILGRHIDHRGGSVNPVAVNHMWLVSAPRQDDWVVARNAESDAFPEERFRISKCLPKGRSISDWDAWCHDEYEKRRGRADITWTNYVRAAVLYLQHVWTDRDGSCAPALCGMDMVFYGDVPRAVGLSSSSAVVVASAEAVARLNGLEIPTDEMVTHCGLAEWYVGTRGGSSDHAAIIHAAPDAVLHATAFPLTVSSAPIPSGYSLVLANSLLQAKKQAGARNAFNGRVAAYEIGLLLIRKLFTQYAEALQYLRDVNPGSLGVDDSEIYRIVRSLPTTVRRVDALRMLPEDDATLHHVFRSHDEPDAGYPVRQVCLYGIAECIRADMVTECLRAADMPRFGDLMNISHDGDRVTQLSNGTRVPTDNSYPDARIDGLIGDLESGEPGRIARAPLWRQGGGYNCSLPEIDELVDIALATPGVLGAGLVGAGMGGCIVAVVEADRAQQLIDNLTRQYYAPRSLTPAAEIITPVGGLQTFQL